jgi:hypothetical protein
MAGLRSDLRTLAATLYNGPPLTNMRESSSTGTGVCDGPCPGNPCTTYPHLGPPQLGQALLPSSQPPIYQLHSAIPSCILPQPSALTQITNGATIGSHSLPERGLVIPDVPTRHSDGSHTPRAASWKQIVKHWTDGDPKCGLLLPLRDWPPEWIRGKNKKFFAMKYHQRSVIALEFLDR